MPNHYQNEEQDRRIKTVEEHIGTMNEEMGSIKTDVAQIKTDVDWLKRTYWIIATATFGTLVATLFGLLGK